MRRQDFSLLKRGSFYYFYYYDAEGKRWRRSTGERSPVAAERAARKFLGQGTLEDFASGFFAEDSEWVKAKRDAGKSLSPRYLQEKTYHLTAHIFPVFGSWNVNAISAPDIRRWILSLPKSTQTRKHILQTFRDVMQEAVFLGRIDRNPAEEAGNITARHEQREVYSAAELQMLFPVDDEQLIDVWGSLQYATLFLLLATTGLRNSEARELLWSDVDLHSGLLVVRGTKTQTSRRPALITERAGRVLARHQRSFSRPEAFVFPGAKAGSPITRRSVSQRLRKVLQEQREKALSGDPDSPLFARRLDVHSFRHTFVTRMEEKLPQKHLMILSGHSTAKMLDHYTHRELLEVGASLRHHTSLVESSVFSADSSIGDGSSARSRAG